MLTRGDLAAAAHPTTAAGPLLDRATARLAAAGSTSPRLDSQLLLMQATGWQRTAVLAHPEWSLPGPALATFDALVARRAAGEPMAYILGAREFYARAFRVDRRALIPRPETELLVSLAIRSVARWRAAGIRPAIVDVGTGSGAIAVTVAAETGASLVATDVSRAALTLAGENAVLHGQEGRVRLVQSDLLAAVRGPVHLVMANLPYVPAGRRLPRDVAEYEPPVALYAGPVGTELIARLMADAAPMLAPGGELLLELDDLDQAAELRRLASTLYPTGDTRVHLDAAGRARVLWLRTRGGGACRPRATVS